MKVCVFLSAVFTLFHYSGIKGNYIYVPIISSRPIRLVMNLHSAFVASMSELIRLPLIFRSAPENTDLLNPFQVRKTLTQVKPEKI